jgi:hypothetical protein
MVIWGEVSAWGCNNMRCKWSLWPTSRVRKVPAWVVAGKHWLLYQEVASAVFKGYSSNNAAPVTWLLCVIIIPFLPAYSKSRGQLNQLSKVMVTSQAPVITVLAGLGWCGGSCRCGAGNVGVLEDLSLCRDVGKPTAPLWPPMLLTPWPSHNPIFLKC